jgi:geranylgeranyl diphosphate synthase type I
MAILIGDLAGVFADRLMTGVPSETKAIWDEMRIEVNLGQMLDVLGSASGDRTIERAERVCRYKSAKYSIERPLHLGASLRGASDQVMQALSAYGLPLGEAFQMRDDVMGVFGDPEVTGKPVGDDLREAKPTPLVARAVARADRSQAEVLRMIGQADLTPSDISSIQEVIIATGALDELEGAIDDRVRRAVDALDGVISAQAVAPLTELASFIVDRAN